MGVLQVGPPGAGLLKPDRRIALRAPPPIVLGAPAAQFRSLGVGPLEKQFPLSLNAVLHSLRKHDVGVGVPIALVVKRPFIDMFVSKLLGNKLADKLALLFVAVSEEYGSEVPVGAKAEIAKPVQVKTVAAKPVQTKAEVTESVQKQGCQKPAWAWITRQYPVRKHYQGQD